MKNNLTSTMQQIDVSPKDFINTPKAKELGWNIHNHCFPEVPYTYFAYFQDVEDALSLSCHQENSLNWELNIKKDTEVVTTYFLSKNDAYQFIKMFFGIEVNESFARIEEPVNCCDEPFVRDIFYIWSCPTCKSSFDKDGWYCEPSPDKRCHYYSRDGKISLRNGNTVDIPTDHDPEYETDDCCIFCGDPDERK